jgi:hypothetical protein
METPLLSHAQKVVSGASWHLTMRSSGKKRRAGEGGVSRKS